VAPEVKEPASLLSVIPYPVHNKSGQDRLIAEVWHGLAERPKAYRQPPAEGL
jgi:hypothetical protein